MKRSQNKQRIIFLLCLLILSSFLGYTSDIKPKQPSANDNNIIEFKENINYYVSNNGNDNNNGTLENPFKTIFKAVSAITNNNTAQNTIFTVNIMKGSYFFNRSLKIDNLNSNNKIIFKPYENDLVTFTGGINLPSNNFISLNSSKYSDNNLSSEIMIYDLSPIGLNFTPHDKYILDAPALIANHDTMLLARYPNTGFLKIDNVVNDKSFICNDLDINSVNYNKNIFLDGYWKYNWGDQIVRLNDIDKDNKKISIDDNLQYELTENQKFYFLNILSGLDSKGEYYIDYDNNLLYFIPPSDLSSLEIELSLLNEPLITINNCNNIDFENITIEDGRSSAVNITNSNNINLESCTIRNFSDTAVTIHSGINDTISNNKIYNLGGNGILVTGGNRTTLESCKHIISNNSIYNYSRLKRTYTPAISANGVGITVSYNIIHDAPDSGIVFSGNDHVIEHNELYDICTEADDVGAIYCGADWTARGNLIQYNNIHDICYNSNKNMAVAIYLDDCFSSANVNNNTITRVNTAMNIGGGRDNIIVQNKITDCKNSIIFDNRGEVWANLNQISENSKGIPFDSAIWLEKYPEIKTLINNDNPGVPYNNKVADNTIKNSGKPQISPSVIKNGTILIN